MYTVDSFNSYTLSYLYGKVRSIYEYYISNYLWENKDINNVYSDIYISDIGTAYNVELLDELGITHIVNAVLAIEPAFPDKYEYLSVDLRDISNENIENEFDKVNEFIDLALSNGGKVLVHCIAGVSRSASLVASYLINKKNLSFDEALKILKNNRPKIEPNNGFKKQLQEIKPYHTKDLRFSQLKMHTFENI